VHSLAIAHTELRIAVPGRPEWFILAQLEVVLHAERARLDVKLDAMRRALDGMRDSQLSPG